MDITKPKIYLAGATDENYLQKSMDYLRTMNENSNVNNVFFTLDFDISEDIKKRFSSIKFVRISSDIIKSPNSNNCIQHGGFLEALDFVSEDSIVIFTDTDVKVQRGFSESELSMLENCEDGQVLVNYNVSEDRTLLEDCKEIQPNLSEEEILKLYPEIESYKCFNTGVIAAKHKTYRNLYERYNQYWPDFKDVFVAYVKQQWLLTYLIQKEFQAYILPYTFHCHDRSPVFVDNKLRQDLVGYKFCIEGDVVVFNHHIRHPSHYKINNLKKKIRFLYKILIAIALVSITLILMILT